jgi:hypothetical protein
MGKQSPAPPDFTAAATATADASAANTAAQTQANRPNQTNAFGSSVQWTQGPNGQWQQTQSLGGGLGQAAEGLQQQVAGLSQPFSFAQFGQAGTGDEARNQAITSAYNQATSRLDPQWQQREAAQRTSLLNQGLTEGSEAYTNAMRDMGQQRNDAYSSAMASAIGQGTAAGDSVFRNNLMSRQQSISEALRQRGMPLEELGALGGFLGQAGFNGAGTSQGPDLLGAAGLQYNADFGNWQANNQMMGQNVGAGMQLLQALPGLFALSDIRAKQDVRRLDVEALPGVPFATWRYLPAHGEDSTVHVGVIAQDLARVAPAYVRTREDGLLEVDYSFLSEVK